MGQSNASARNGASARTSAAPCWHPEHAEEIRDLMTEERSAYVQLMDANTKRSDQITRLINMTRLAAAARHIIILSANYYGMSYGLPSIIGSLQVGLTVVEACLTIRLTTTNDDFKREGAVDVILDSDAAAAAQGHGRDIRRVREGSSLSTYPTLQIFSALIAQPILLLAFLIRDTQAAIGISEQDTYPAVWFGFLILYSATTLILMKVPIRLAMVRAPMVSIRKNEWQDKVVSFFCGTKSSEALINYWSVCVSRAAGLSARRQGNTQVAGSTKIGKLILRPIYSLLGIPNILQSAAVAQHGTSSPGQPLTSEEQVKKSLAKLKGGKPVKQEDANAPTCVVCMQNRPDVLFIPCGHASCCVECVRGMAEGALESPKRKSGSAGYGVASAYSSTSAAAVISDVEHKCPLCQQLVEDVFYPAIW